MKLSEERQHLIYSYVDPRSGEIFYIGQSTRGLERAYEFNRHYAWCLNTINKIRQSGLKVIVRIIQEFEPFVGIESVLDDAETYWIRDHRSRGCPLTNCTDGGKYKDPRKTFEGRSLSNRGQKRTTEARERMSVAAKARGFRPETIEAMRLANTGKKRSESSRQKMRAKALGRRVPDSARQMISLKLKGRKFSIETRIRMINSRMKGEPHVIVL